MQHFLKLVNYFVFFFFKNFSATFAATTFFTTLISTSFLPVSTALRCFFLHRFATGAEL
jgi:hypothetical protein